MHNNSKNQFDMEQIAVSLYFFDLSLNNFIYAVTPFQNFPFHPGPMLIVINGKSIK